jgi:hypothetical protein
MHWRLEPIIWVLIIGTLALLAIPRPAHPGPPVAQRATGTPTAPREASPPAQGPRAVRDASPETSLAIRHACDGDVRRLCPKEYAARDRAGIRACMKTNWTQISAACVAAWLREHPQ